MPRGVHLVGVLPVAPPAPTRNTCSALAIEDGAGLKQDKPVMATNVSRVPWEPLPTSRQARHRGARSITAKLRHGQLTVSDKNHFVGGGPMELVEIVAGVA